MNSKKHHYVPQSILKRFSINNDAKEIYVFDKETEKIFNSSIVNAGSENQFNTIKTSEENINLEFLYQNIDSIYAEITSKIVDEGTLEYFSNQNYTELAFVIACQLKRTKISRSTLEYLDNELNNTLKEVSSKISGVKNEYNNLSTEEIKAFTILTSIDVEEEIISLLSKEIYLVKNTSKIPFIISDCPVIIHNSFPYGQSGLDSEGSEVYFPLSTEYLVCFCCKTVFTKIETYKTLGANSTFANNLVNSIKEKLAFEVSDEQFIEFYNQLQILNSYRFIYSSVNNFDLAKETIKVIPESKRRKTTIKLGGLGKAPPPNTKLPLGELLVVFGSNDHNLLEIEIVEQSDARIYFKCENEFLLSIILKDAPLKRVEVYRDQSLIRMMGKPEILKCVNNLYQLTHSDKSIEKLFELIKKNKNER